jgi:diguanylate cyclase (GGDEF)-like protein/PAS domain S-box-containing protein
MDRSFIFPILEQAALMMALAYLYCLIPRNERHQHTDGYLFVIGLLTSFACIFLLEHGLYSVELVTNSQLLGSQVRALAFKPVDPLEHNAALLVANTIVLSLVALFFGWVPLTISLFSISLYSVYFTDIPLFTLTSSFIASGLLGLLWRHFKADELGDSKLMYFYALGTCVGLTLLITFYVADEPWLDKHWQVSLFMGLVLTPLITLILGRLLSKQVFFERDKQGKLQDYFLFKNQFDIGNIGIAITSKSKRWLKVNPYVCKMLKYSDKELMQLTWKDLTYPEDLEKDLTYFNRMLKGEINEYEIDKRFVAKDGSIIYTHLSVACRHFNDDSFLVIAGFLDITQLKKAEAALQSSKEQLALVLESSELGIWDWDINSNKVDSNLRSAQILGCDLTALNLDPSLWSHAIVSEDRKKLLKSLIDIRKGAIVSRRMEYRLNTFNGDVRWILDTGKVVDYDESGKPLRMCGTHTDISDLKRAEESLRIAASVYHNSSEAMSVFDFQGKIVNTNPAFSEITGFSAAEIKGKHLSTLQGGDQNELFNQQIKQHLFEKRYWQGEMLHQRENGQQYTAWVTINTIGEFDTNETLSVMLFSDISEKKQTEELIWLQANYDTLTGLPNRRMLLEHMKVQIANSSRENSHFALLFLDLDFFKEVNDSLGHDIGDKLLIETSERIKACTRDSDLVARLGGDEFTIVLNNFNNQKGIERVANKILKNLSEPFVLENEMAYISGSIGITLYPEDALSIEELLKNADQAMYSAKSHGRNRFHYFTPQMQEVALKRMKLIQDLKVAIKLEQFELYYQPIIDFTTDKVVKAEALIRWRHPKLGFVSPADFIPIAEDTGMIVNIGNWVFRRACQQAADWKSTHGVDIQISINKSPVQFRDDHSTVKRWIQLLSDLKLDPSCICIEITEGLLLDSESEVEVKLLAFRDSGIQISLDDFGTGYSSLSYLKKFHIDYLKIDKSFVSNLKENGDDLSLCEAIIVMAHKLGIKVIAEGIETKLQRDMLIYAGCDYGQGYLFSKPIPASEFELRYFTDKDPLKNHKNRA